MTAALSQVEGQLLARLAAGAVRAQLAGTTLTAHIPRIGPLQEPGASFVTLERSGKLRGCVGTLLAVRPLHRDVVDNAVRAMKDPRLPPVTADDWPELDVTVSVLTPPVEVPVDGREALLGALRPGIDGLTLTDGTRRATFLPSVWQSLTDPTRFVDALLRKGGWDGWPEGLRAQVYGSSEFVDSCGARPPL